MNRNQVDVGTRFLCNQNLEECTVAQKVAPNTNEFTKKKKKKEALSPVHNTLMGEGH